MLGMAGGDGSLAVVAAVAGACQPSHRWYKVGAGTPVIV